MGRAETVLAPGGFIKLDRVREGTPVRTPGGGTAKVIRAERKQARILKVSFSDGAEALCTEETLWLSRATDDNRTIRVRPLREVMAMMQRGRNAAIPLCGPVSFEGENSLPIKPYTFGALLGDGCTLRDPVTITKGDMELFDRIRAEGYELKRYGENSGRTPVFAIKGFAKEKAWLSTMGLRCRGYRKYVPSEYKYAPVEDRMELIRGLMDTDGYADRNGSCSFSSTSKRLAKDMQWLIRSVGGKARITTKIPYCTFGDGTRKRCRKAYLVFIQMPDNRELFTIPRKRGRCHERNTPDDGFHPGRRITGVSEGGTGTHTTLVIDSEDGLYITGDFIVRHDARDGEGMQKYIYNQEIAE